MSFPRYQVYKPSGLEWLQDVPAHWLPTQVKHVCSFTTGWTPPTGNSAAYEGSNLWANISDLGPKVLSECAKRISDDAVASAGLTLSKAGSLLFSFKLSIGQVSFAGVDMYTNEAIATFPPVPSIDLHYAYYSFPLFLVQNATENIYGAKLRGFHRGIGIQALGDGVGDDGLTLFLEQRDQLFLLCHQRVDLGGLAIEEGGDG